jgi:hypothetical protein
VIRFLTVSTFASLLALISHTDSANAKCNGPYLQNSQGEVRTSNCEYDYLARVAASYGLHVSGDQLRNSFSEMISVCQLVHHDNRVWDICQNVNGNNCLYFSCN